MKALVRVSRRVRLGAVTAGIVLAGLLAASPALAGSGPIIYQYAGNGTFGPPTPGPATSSPLRNPFGVAVDAAGNIYIADRKAGVVEKVTPAGILSIFAGNGMGGPPVPGPATSSPINASAVAVDGAGNVYISDGVYVVKVTPDGTLSVFAGNGTSGAPVPGPATSSPLGNVDGLAVDSAGDVYLSDLFNQVVEKVTAGGTLSIYAGTGTAGPPTPGPATSSSLNFPSGLAVDGAGDLYIADRNNYDVEEVTPNGNLSIVAGNGVSGPPTPGPATSSNLGSPEGVAVDGAGNLYIADPVNQEIEMVAPGGTLSIFAGTGAPGAPTYGGPASASALDFPFGVAAASGGTVFIGDAQNRTVDAVGYTPGPPGQPILTPGDGSAQLAFAPADPGTSAILAYQISFDGGNTWQPIATSTGPGGTLTTTLTGLTDGTTYDLIVRAVNPLGPGSDSAGGAVTPEPAPANLAPPAISGVARVGDGLSCSAGSWTNDPTEFAYQWDRDGAPIAGAGASTYAVGSADQGHTLTCTVTASNPAGSATATGAGVFIPIANGSLCPKPSGELHAARLGPLWLGLSRSRAHRMLPRFDVYSAHTDNFCLAGGWGIRAGYETSRLRRQLPGRPSAQGIVLLLTANPYYTLDGISPGTRLNAALGKPIHWGPNWWYVIPGPRANWVLKVQGGVIREIGIASKQLTATRLDQVWFLAHF